MEKTARFQELIGLGVARIATSSAWEIYNEWVREANAPSKLAEPKTEEKTAESEEKEEKTESKTSAPEKKESADAQEKKGNPETDYCCRLVGSDLKFL